MHQVPFKAGCLIFLLVFTLIAAGCIKTEERRPKREAKAAKPVLIPWVAYRGSGRTTSDYQVIIQNPRGPEIRVKDLYVSPVNDAGKKPRSQPLWIEVELGDENKALLKPGRDNAFFVEVPNLLLQEPLHARNEKFVVDIHGLVPNPGGKPETMRLMKTVDVVHPNRPVP